MLARDVLAYWLGPASDRDAPSESVSKKWFSGGADVDDVIRERFGQAVERALAGELDEWADTPRGRVALVILLDQFTRNLYRGDARSYAGDAKALDLARQGLVDGHESELAPTERYFLYMPFMHAEDPVAQARSVALFSALAREGPSRIDGSRWAERHCAVVERFGRFPSRNAVLGRESTPEERAFLEENPTGF